MPDKTTRSQSKLEFKEFKLNALLEITKAINSNMSADKLFGLFEFILRTQLNIGKTILFNNTGEDWECVLKYGVKGHERKFSVEDDLLHIKEITVIESSSKEHLNTFDVVIPVHHKSLPLAYLLLGDLDEYEINISPIIKHLAFIQTLTNIVIGAIENKRFAREHIRQERVKKELELASEMQSMLFPAVLPDDEHLQVAAYYQPHQQVGGDYYDLIQLNEEEVVFCLADVSGKGVSAALLMANFQANLRALIHYKPSLIDLVKELNGKVMSNAKGEKFITLFVAKYNQITRELSYINAAHNPPLLCNDDSVSQLTDGCTGLGMFDELPKIKLGKVSIPKDAILLGFTDGVVEIEDADGQSFGTNTLIRLLKRNQADHMEKLSEKILKAANKHRGEMPFVDDIALFICRFF